MRVSVVRDTDWAAKLAPPRRLKLVARALLFILLSLAAFTAIAASPTALKGLSGITLSYPGYIRLTNCILALICGAFLVWPKESGKLVGSWNKYVGLAFFTFSVQYGLRFIAIILGFEFPDYKWYFGAVTDVVVYLGSYFNNLLILAAARVLLNKNRRAQAAAAAVEGTGRWPRLRREWAKLRAALPDWYWMMFLLTLLALLERLEGLAPDFLRAWLASDFMHAWFMRGLLFVRFPDAIFSVYCLGWFAYAVWLTFYVRRRGALAWLGFVLVLAYAAGQVVYAANPFIARSLSEPRLGWFPATTVRSFLEPKVSGDIQRKVDEENLEAAAAAARGEVRTKKEPKRFVEGAQDYFDNAIFAILFPMKSLLFLPAFMLYLLLLSSVNGFRQVQRELTNERKNYLSKDGILYVIGDSMEADELALIIRLPGLKRGRAKKDERVISEVWRAEGSRTWWNKPQMSSLDGDLLLRLAMKEKGEDIIITDRDEDAAAAGLHKDDPLPQTLVLVPIKFHGGVIGVLRVIFRGYGKYYDGTLEQLKFMAELIAPSVQDFRTVSAVDKLGPRLSRAQAAKQDAAHGQGDGPANSFQHATEKMAETLSDLLSPLSVGLRLNCGFTPVRRAHPVEGIYHDILKRPEVGYDPPEASGKDEVPADGAASKRPRGANGEELPIIVQTENGPVRIERDPLIVRTDKNTPLDLGTLFLAIPDDRDEFSHPTLAAYYLTRRTVASQTAHGIFNAARNALGILIQDLSVSLNKETLSPAEWFAEVEATVRKSGLLWVVASLGDGEPPLGEPEHVGILERLDDTERETLMSKPLGCVPNTDPQSATRHIIYLRLKREGQYLCLGVERTQFGPELNSKSPWKVFLLNLANVAGVALVSIEERRRAEEERQWEETKRVREADDEWLKIFADLNATVMHQLTNMVHSMLSIVLKLEILSGKPKSPDGQLPEAVAEMKTYAVLMQQVAAAYRRLVQGDGGGSCDIAEAAQLAERLFRYDLKEKRIRIELVVQPGAITVVPSYVVALALASLIGNAVDAIQSHGKITIRAKPEGSDVWCHVSNDGPPIPEDIKRNLFRPGPKGKAGHSGWGLYLVQRSLQNYGGEADLSHSEPEETCFTLRLPKSNNPSPND